MRPASGGREDQISRRQNLSEGGGAPGNAAQRTRAAPSTVANVGSGVAGTGKAVSTTGGRSGDAGSVTPSVQCTSQATVCGGAGSGAAAPHGWCVDFLRGGGVSDHRGRRRTLYRTGIGGHRQLGEQNAKPGNERDTAAK